MYSYVKGPTIKSLEENNHKRILELATDNRFHTRFVVRERKESIMRSKLLLGSLEVCSLRKGFNFRISEVASRAPEGF